MPLVPAEAKVSIKFEASLVYTESSRIARGHRETLSQQSNMEYGIVLPGLLAKRKKNPFQKTKSGDLYGFYMFATNNSK